MEIPKDIVSVRHQLEMVLKTDSRIFETNIAALNSLDPDLASAILQIPPDPSWEIVFAENGQITARKVVGNGLFRYVHSRIDPGMEAETWAKLIPETAGAVAVLGFGLGYPVSALKKRLSTARLILLEADLSLFRFAVEYSDLTTIFTSSRVDLYLGFEPIEIKKLLNSVRPDLILSRAFLPVTNLRPEYYREIMTILDDYIFEHQIRKTPELSRGIEDFLKQIVD